MQINSIYVQHMYSVCTGYVQRMRSVCAAYVQRMWLTIKTLLGGIKSNAADYYKCGMEVEYQCDPGLYIQPKHIKMESLGLLMWQSLLVLYIFMLNFHWIICYYSYHDYHSYHSYHSNHSYHSYHSYYSYHSYHVVTIVTIFTMVTLVTMITI